MLGWPSPISEAGEVLALGFFFHALSLRFCGWSVNSDFFAIGFLVWVFGGVGHSLLDEVGPGGVGGFAEVVEFGVVFLAEAAAEGDGLAEEAEDDWLRGGLVVFGAAFPGFREAAFFGAGFVESQATGAHGAGSGQVHGLAALAEPFLAVAKLELALPGHGKTSEFVFDRNWSCHISEMY